MKIGIASLEEYKARTLAVARGESVPPAGGPKVWFPSPESLARVLSEKNRALLALIARGPPRGASWGRGAAARSRTCRGR